MLTILLVIATVSSTVFTCLLILAYIMHSEQLERKFLEIELYKKRVRQLSMLLTHATHERCILCNDDNFIAGSYHEMFIDSWGLEHKTCQECKNSKKFNYMLVNYYNNEEKEYILNL